jgi:hypothetical protein
VAINGRTSLDSVSRLGKGRFNVGGFMRTALRLWIAVDYLIALPYLNTSTSWIITPKDGRLFVLLLCYAQPTDTNVKQLCTNISWQPKIKLLTEIHLSISNRLPSLSITLRLPMSLRIPISLRELEDCASKSQQLISLIILVVIWL